ncbi:tyrosine-type recombinase/integrase [Ancylobacter sp. VNQ12]|uniref:tyrosine-type recombinase/integrase n=1 Tax=Ancylobacter sp. VNQ12 TaxID=3400920 RepID=UPI003C0C6F0F
MARNLLTVMEIKNSTATKLRDGEGLCLHTKGAKRYWVFIYTRRGRRRELGLGPYGTGAGEVSLAAARVKADEVRAILAAGGDPFAETEARKVAAPIITFGEIFDQYVELKKSQWRGRQTEARWKRTATMYAKGLRKLPIADVTTDDVVKVLKPIWTVMPESAAKVREHIKLVLDHAKARKLRTGENPAEWRGHLDQILPKRDVLAKTNHAAMPYPEVPAFMKSLRAVDTVAARCLEFIVLTAVRSGEGRGAMWAEVDLDSAVWTIPARRTKAGREHRVPLSPRAVAILTARRGVAAGDLVFPGRVAGRPMTDPTMAKTLAETAGAGLTVHGFRSSFRDWAGEATEFQREVAEAALAHAVGDGAERAYRRGDALAKRRKMMDGWAEFCGGVKK